MRRVTAEFSEFIEGDEAKVYDILELPHRLTEFELNQKLIFVVKKQTDNLSRLEGALLSTYPALATKRILIVDDEADNASIGYVNDRVLGLQLRTIADQVDQLRGQLTQSAFLQVTATPYSLYLQPAEAPIPGDSLLPVRPALHEAGFLSTRTTSAGTSTSRTHAILPIPQHLSTPQFRTMSSQS